MLNNDQPENWWAKHRPVIVQTAACGITEKSDQNIPYFRKITISKDGQITDFRVMNASGYVEPGPLSDKKRL